VRETQKEHAWEIGLRHALGPQLALFGRAGRSFRFVNAEEIYEFDAFGGQSIPDPATSALGHARGGVEWRSGGNALRATLFRSDVSNEIHLDPFSTGVGNTNLRLRPRRASSSTAAGRRQARCGLQAAMRIPMPNFAKGSLTALERFFPLLGKPCRLCRATR